MSARGWLLSDAPTSRWQARAGRAYAGWLALSRNRLAMVGLAIVGGLVVVAALAPWLAPYPPDLTDLGARLRPPSAAHWLGTDEMGRDILSRLLHGARLTLWIVAGVAVAAAPAG
ncbi:MAG: D,D-dipeptide ABC transporter permease, partial [Alphaproteobacteria bacterium]|nr:D,D-dipeptide ABC transporter permease [Alphaproteobacteria bacterium]